MFRRLLFLCVLLLSAMSVFANNNLTLEINGIVVQGGRVYVALYSNEADYKEKKIHHQVLFSIPQQVPLHTTLICQTANMLYLFFKIKTQMENWMLVFSAYPKKRSV
jgi:uncharacterized protein YccT (UPF0319 family)